MVTITTNTLQEYQPISNIISYLLSSLKYKRAHDNFNKSLVKNNYLLVKQAHVIYNTYHFR